jgi:hypothetical protein
MSEETFNKQEIQEIITYLQKIMETKEDKPHISQPIQEKPILLQETSTCLPSISELAKNLVSVMKPIIHWTDNSIETCDICKQDIVLGKNLSGLVVNDSFFACETCCQKTPHNDLLNWTKSKISTSNTVRPIGLWLTQEKNKERTVLIKQ